MAQQSSTTFWASSRGVPPFSTSGCLTRGPNLKPSRSSSSPGVIAHGVHLTLKASTLEPGRVNPDLLQVAIRQAKVLYGRGEQAALEALLDRFDRTQQVFIARSIPMGALPQQVNYDLPWYTVKTRIPFALRNFEAYAMKMAEAGQKVRILVGRGNPGARSGWNSHGTVPLPPGHPEVYTVDINPKTLPDLTADITSLESMVSVTRGSVDEIVLDGVTFPSVYNAGLVAVLADKLKPGGHFLTTFRAFPADFEAQLGGGGFRSLPDQSNYLGYDHALKTYALGGTGGELEPKP